MVKGEVLVQLKNKDTGEIHYTSDVIENSFTNAVWWSTSLPRMPVLTNTSSINGSFNGGTLNTQAAVNMGGFLLMVGDTYIPTINKNFFTLPGNFYQTENPSSVEPVLITRDNESFTITITKELQPPLSISSRNLHTLSLCRLGSSIVHLSCASFPSPVVQTANDIAVIQYTITVTIEASTTQDWWTLYSEATYRFGGASATNTTSTYTYLGNSEFQFNTYIPNNSTTTLSLSNSTFALNATKNRASSWSGTFVANQPNISSRLPLMYNTSDATMTVPIVYCGWDGLYLMKNTETITASNLGAIRGMIAVYGQQRTHTGWWGSLIGSTTNKTQAYQTKINLPTTPYFNISEIPTTNATLFLDTVNYESRIPEYWKIDFSGTTGGVGIAEYSFMKRYITGWNENTFSGRTIQAYGLSNNQGYNDATMLTGATVYRELFDYGIRESGPVPQSSIGELSQSPFKLYSGDTSWIYHVVADEIIFYNMVDQIPIRISGRNYPVFGAEYISAIEYDELSDTFWVACPTTGLYSVTNPTQSSISINSYNLSSLPDVASTTQNKAYTLALGTSQTTHRTVWAIIEGALVKSTNNGSTWTAYDSTSTGGVTFTQSNIESSWEHTLAMNADKQTDNRLLIIYVDSGAAGATYSGLRVHKGYAFWWSATNDSTNLLSTNSPLAFLPTNSYLTSNFSNIISANIGYTVASVESLWSDNVTNYNGYASYSRRQLKDQFGCTKNQSHWWLRNYWGVLALETPTPTHNLVGGTPLEIYFEQQIDGSPNNYDIFPPEFLTSWNGGATTSNNFSYSSSSSPYLNDWQLSTRYDGGRHSNTNSNQGNYYNNVFYEATDDDGNDCLIVNGAYFGTPIGSYDIPGFYKLEFSNHSTTKLDSITGYYLGRGLCDVGAGIQHVGDSFYGWDVSAKLIGEIWERYKWTGSAWVRRVDDNDPLTVKTTHATTDNLIGGATISFDDSGATQSFTSGELIATTVCDGIQNDKATEWTGYSVIASRLSSTYENISLALSANTPTEQVPFYKIIDGDPSQKSTTTPTITAGNFYSINTSQTVLTYSAENGNYPITTKYYYTDNNQDGLPKYMFSANNGGSTNYNGTPGTFTNAVRFKTSNSFSGDFNLYSTPQESDLSSLDYYKLVFNYTDTWNSPLTQGTNKYSSWGLVDAADYTDSASPESANTNIQSWTDIKYGFRLIQQNNTTGSFGTEESSVQRASSSIRNWSSYTGNATNYSERYSSQMSYSYPIELQIIESGVVKYSNTDYNYRNLIGSGNEGFDGSYYDLETSSGTQGNVWGSSNVWSGTARYTFFPRYIGTGSMFRIERVGTTINYYLNDTLLYTSLLSSTESLIPALANTQEYYGGGNYGYINHSETRLLLNMYSPAQNDYWVKVGEASPATGAYRTDFSHLLCSYRQAFSITIDGVEADVIGYNSSNNLVAGEVTIYPLEGLIRFSSADAGKAISVNMGCAYYESV